MKKALAIFAALALWLYGARAWADVYDIHARLACAEDRSIAVIQFAGAYNGAAPQWFAVPDGLDGGVSARPPEDNVARDPGGEACRLANGVEVAYERSRVKPSAGGVCGGAPPERIDLWVDSKRLFERREFTDCSTLLFHSVIIAPDLVMLCSYADMPASRFIQHGEPRPVRCEPLVETHNALLPDYHRYPPPGETIRSGLRFAVSADLCARVLSAGEAKFDTARLGTTYSYLGRAYFDLDNDGRPDPVYRVDPSYPLSWTTIHVVDADPFPTDESRRKAHPYNVQDELAAQARVSVGGPPSRALRTILTAPDVTLRMLDDRVYVVVDKRASGVRDTDLQTVVYVGDAAVGLRTVCVFGWP